MKKRFLYITLLTLSCAVTAFSQDPPKDDAINHSILKEYTLNPDGSMTYRFSREQQLLTYRAINSLYGETFVVYDPGHQKLEITRCETTMADGKVIKAPANAFNEVLPGFASNAPDYNALREMVITHTGLERNAVVRLDYTIRTEKGFFPALAADEVLAEPDPVRLLTIRVRIPESSTLVYKPANMEKEPVKTTEAGFRIFTWTFENIPAVSPEEFQPAGNEEQPRLLFSTEPDASRSWNWLTSQEAFDLAASPAMKSAVEKATGEKLSGLKLALKLQELVVGDINLTPVPLRYTGFRIRPPDQVWSGNYGTLPEKAVLLCTLLRAAGIDAFPVVTFRPSSWSDKWANLYGIDDVVVKAYLSDGTALHLSVATLNGSDMTRAQSGKIFVPLSKGTTLPVLKTEPEPGTGTFTGTFILNEKAELKGSGELTVTGPMNPFLAAARDENKPKQWIGGVSGKEVKEIRALKQPDIAQSGYSLTVEKDQALKKDSLLRIFALPYLASGAESWGIRQLPSYRNAPLEVPFPVNESTTLTLTVPENLELLTQEDEIVVSNSAGMFRFEVRKETGQIMVTKSLEIRNKVIGTRDYPAFKALMDQWNQPRTRELVFRVR